MKNKHLFSHGKTYSLWLATSLFLFGSCTVGLHEEGEFNPGVSNTTLSAPEVTARASADGSKTELSWPIVMGAGGYELTLYNINNPDNPQVVVVEKITESSEEGVPDKVETTVYENYFVDGSNVSVPRYEDTNYKLVIKTLGNEKYNNKDSEPKEVLFTSIVPKLNETPIPAGTDLTQWFAENQALVDAQTEEFALELTGGETYTMSGPIDLDNHLFTLRSSDKINLPTIEMEATAGFVTEAGLKIKYVNLDCTNMTDDKASIIALNPTPTFAMTVKHYLIDSSTPFAIQNCNIKNLSRRLFWDSGTKYVPYTILISNSIIGLDQAAQKKKSVQTIDLANSFCFNFTLQNSTVYSTTAGTSFFVQYNGSEKPSNILNGIYPTCTISYLNNTMVNITKGSSGGSNYMTSYGKLKGQKECTTIVKNNIFVDCSCNRVIRGAFMQGQNGGMIVAFENNCYWYNGAEPGGTDWDKSDRVSFDPQLTQTTEGYYTVGGVEVKTAGCGDPRGL